MCSSNPGVCICAYSPGSIYLHFKHLANALKEMRKEWWNKRRGKQTTPSFLSLSVCKSRLCDACTTFWATFRQKHFNQPSSTHGPQHTPAQTLHTHTHTHKAILTCLDWLTVSICLFSPEHTHTYTHTCTHTLICLECRCRWKQSLRYYYTLHFRKPDDSCFYMRNHKTIKDDLQAAASRSRMRWGANKWHCCVQLTLCSLPCKISHIHSVRASGKTGWQHWQKYYVDELQQTHTW